MVVGLRSSAGRWHWRLALVGVVLIALALAGCGNQPDPTGAAPRPASAQVGGVRESSLERALRRHANADVSSVSCRPPTGADAARAPFGHTQLPVLSCLVGSHDRHAWYDVEVLRDGCFLAERAVGGGDLRGCGIRALEPRRET
jgi:hypothetical protein